MPSRKFWIALCLCLYGLGFCYQNAYSRPLPRYQKDTKTGWVHLLQLKRWSDQRVLCEIYITHDGLPTETEFNGYCGSDYYAQWLTTPACNTAETDGVSEDCLGLYVVHLGKYYMEYPAMVSLPSAQAAYSIVDCGSGKWCSKKMSLRVEGSEPLDGFQIDEVHITVDGKSLTCKNRSECEFLLPITGEEGIEVEYWVSSTFGDTSPHQSLRLRQVQRTQPNLQYRVDIIDAQATDIDAVVYWDSFPASQSIDTSIYSPVENADALTTNEPLYFLAGKLLLNGVVDGSACPGFGLLENGMADTCGLELATGATIDWQNQFNQQIFDVANQYEMPPKIIKGIIAQETQFWNDPGLPYEYGMGSLSENGIDVYLSWDLQRFNEVCLKIYEPEVCQYGYNQLGDDQRAKLRGLVLRDVGTDQEIELITRVLKAYSIQVGQTIENMTGLPPGQVTSYESLWDLSIAGYHAGIGCISSGLSLLVVNKQEVNFANYCTVNTSCPSACGFVDRVKTYSQGSQGSQGSQSSPGQ